MSAKIAFAIGCHPDDIEFRIAGTLLLLKQAGYEIHYMNVANGSLGTAQYNRAQTIKIRGGEAKRAAAVLGAHFHPPLVDDLEVFYELKTLRRLGSVVRDVKPTVVLTHPPVDYMEDHTNTCRLAVSAVFTRSMVNFKGLPMRPTYDAEVALYHCMPHGGHDPLRRPLEPEFYVNVTAMHEKKCEALAQHQSQAHWLDLSQGMGAYVKFMEEDSLRLGRLTRKFTHAEGWWRHLHLGFCSPDADPLREALGKNYLPNPKWKKQQTQ